MIARLRRARGWTQQRLADEAGLSRQYIYQIESSRRDGSVRALESIADAIGVPLDDLRAA
uniref:Putative DNA binding, helix-turn-helix domain containing protein n=1 Tax=viral metagenome TaxID=1070528 RepID=A0A6H2A5X4_9ZZZZ